MPAPPLTEEESREQAPPAATAARPTDAVSTSCTSACSESRSPRRPEDGLDDVARRRIGRPLLVHGPAHQPPPLRARRLRWPSTRVRASAPSSCRAARGSTLGGTHGAATLPRRRLRSAVRARRGPSRISPCSWPRSWSRSRARSSRCPRTSASPRPATRWTAWRSTSSGSRGAGRRPAQRAQPPRQGAGDPQARDRRRPRAAARSPTSSRRARSAGSVMLGRTDSRARALLAPHRLRAGGGQPRRATRVLAGGPSRRAGRAWRCGSRRCATRSRRCGARSTTGRGRSSSPRASTATGWRPIPSCSPRSAARPSPRSSSTLLGLEGDAAAKLTTRMDLGARVRGPRARPRPGASPTRSAT